MIQLAHPTGGPAARLDPADSLPIDPADPDGWRISPDLALFHARANTAVIADLHLGYEWARAASGDMVPAHSLRETLDRLETLVSSNRIERLVVAGDLVESARPCVRTNRDVQALRAWLADRKIELVTVLGNHDGPPGATRPESVDVAGWRIAHGHQELAEGRSITGHFHPVLRAGRVAAPCFLIDPERIILPAFSANAAGLNVLGQALPAGLRRFEFRCVAALENRLFDFGALRAVHARLAGRSL